MNAFDFAAPTSVEDAVELLTGHNAAALAGGTDLLNRMKDYVTTPERVVYLRQIASLTGIDGTPAAGVTIGAGTLLAAIVGHAGIRESYPALWQATREVGSPQIRNMATVGGNLLQRPRCWYFRSGFGLLAMKDGKSLVREGDNRYHAIFMTDGNALFVHPSSLAPPLIALGAKATVTGPSGPRTIPVENLYQVPRSDADREITLAPGEILTQLTIPPAQGPNATYEAREKQSHDWPLALASVSLTMDGERVASARVVLTGVAPIPLRCTPAEEAIRGKPVTLETAAAAGAAAVASAKPLSQNAYKVALTQATVKRALLAAVGNRYWEG